VILGGILEDILWNIPERK